MKTKLLAALLMTFALASNAYADKAENASVENKTAKQPTAPNNQKTPFWSGSYSSLTTQSCVPQQKELSQLSYTQLKAGQVQVTQDTTHTYDVWLSSLVSVTTDPVFNTIQDPTAAVGVNLVETPIWWGVIASEKTAPDAAPLNNAQLLMGSSQNYIVITSYNFYAPALNNGVKTGYMLHYHNQKNNNSGWKTGFVYANGNSGSLIHNGTDSASYMINGTPTQVTFDCVENNMLSK